MKSSTIWHLLGVLIYFLFAGKQKQHLQPPMPVKNHRFILFLWMGEEHKKQLFYNWLLYFSLSSWDRVQDTLCSGRVASLCPNFAGRFFDIATDSLTT